MPPSATGASSSTYVRPPRAPTAEEEYLLPPYSTEFDRGTLPEHPSLEETVAYIRDTTEKTHTMMQRMWHALSKVKVSCFRPPRTADGDDTDDVAGRRYADGTPQETDTPAPMETDSGMAGRGSGADTEVDADTAPPTDTATDMDGEAAIPTTTVPAPPLMLTYPGFYVDVPYSQGTGF